jgi:flagellar protein FliO/FliZ
MAQSWWFIVFFVIVLALIPIGLKWFQRRVGAGTVGAAVPMKIISAIGIGVNQRVVTLEIGPPHARTWLTLGVTAQTITCLHSAAQSESVAGHGAETPSTDLTVP